MPALQGWWHIVEQGSAQFAIGIALVPDQSLQIFEGGQLAVGIDQLLKKAAELIKAGRLILWFLAS